MDLENRADESVDPGRIRMLVYDTEGDLGTEDNPLVALDTTNTIGSSHQVRG